MSRTVTRIAASVVASAAIVVGSFVGTSAAQDEEPRNLDSCRVALRHAENAQELSGRISAGIAARSIAQDLGMTEKAREIFRQIRADQQTLADVGTMYRAAADECRG